MKTKKADFRRYVSLNGSYRNHWVTAFNILEFDKSLIVEDNYKLFFSWLYSLSWKSVKIHLLLKGYEVLSNLQIKRLKGGKK